MKEFQLITERGPMKVFAKDKTDALKKAIVDGHRVFVKVTVNINGIETPVIGTVLTCYENNGISNVVVDYENKGIVFRGQFEECRITLYVRPKC